MANLLASAFASGIRARLITGFVDDDVNNLLGVEAEQKGGICLVPLAGAGSRRSQGPPRGEAVSDIPMADPLEFEDQLEYPEILRVHAASSLRSVEEVEVWRGSPALEQPAEETSTE